MATKKCPVCDVPVKLENLERHVRNQHPRADVDLESLLSEVEGREIHAKRTTTRPTMTRRGRQLVIAATIVVAAILVIAIFYPRGSGPNVGQIAPDFTLPTSTVGTVTLSAYRGSVVLLEFMDVDCVYCQEEAGVLRQVYTNYSASVRFLSVDVNFLGQADTMERIEAFKSTYGTTWVYVLDTTGSVMPRYGVTGTPTTFILDGSGVIHEIFVGRPAGGYASYASALDAALQV